MRKLIPILTEKENDPKFLEEALKDTHELILLHVVKREDIGNIPAGYAGSRIKKGEQIMEDIKQIASQRMMVETNMEWGEPTKKIMAVYKINDVDEVVMKKSQEADEMEEELKEANIQVRVI